MTTANRVIIKRVSDSISGCVGCEYFGTWEKRTSPEQYSEGRGYCKQKKRDMGSLWEIIKRDEPSDSGGKSRREWVAIPEWCPLLQAELFDAFRKQMQLTDFKFSD